MPDIIAGLAQHLENQGIGSWQPDGSPYDPDAADAGIYHTGVPGDGARIVVLSLYPGSEGTGEDTRNGWTEPRLQVRTRGGRDPRTALELDRAVREVLHGLGPVVLPDGTDLQDCYSLQSAPLPLGQDASGRWEFSRNYQLTIN